MLLQEYEKPIYNPDPDTGHSPLPTTEMARAEIQEMIEVELSGSVDEVICELLAEMMTVMIPQVLSKAFQDQSETRSITGNIVDSAVARSIERTR